MDADAVRFQSVGQDFPVHARNRRFARGIDVRDDDAVRIVERRAEHFKQIRYARIAVRLKNSDDFFRRDISRGA